jgi:uncharacterized membrane protein YfcA
MLVLGFLIIGVIAGLVAGVFGIGGSVVIIPGLIYLFQMSGLIPEHELMHVVLGSSLASVVFTSAIAAMVHARKNNIQWPIARKLIPGLLLGALLGSYISTLMNTQWLMYIFAGFLALLSTRYMFNWHSDLTYPIPSTPIMWAAGMVIGSLTPMLGLGGGVLIIPFLGLFPLSMREISALSIICILPVVILATLGNIVFGLNVHDLPRYSTGYVYWPAVLPIILTSSICAPLGILLAQNLSIKRLKEIFGFLLLCISISLFMIE